MTNNEMQRQFTLIGPWRYGQRPSWWQQRNHKSAIIKRTAELDLLQRMSMVTHDITQEPNDFLIRDIHCKGIT
jgi:hypothetical protein